MSIKSDLPLQDGQSWHGVVAIAENRCVAADTYQVRFACEPIARGVLPGQFVMLKFACPTVAEGEACDGGERAALGGCKDPLLGRPLAVYRAEPDEQGRPRWIDLIYLTVGKMTGRLATMRPGDLLEVWGPLGKPFFADGCDTEEGVDHLIMVAGGVGQTPLYLLAEEALGKRTSPGVQRKPLRADRVTLCYGARSQECLAGVDDFRRLGVEVFLATEDGSAGHKGLVTDVLRSVLDANRGKSQIVACGPKRMMAAAAEIAKEQGIACQVSLEERMACGIGICFSCVAKVKNASGGWSYRRTCIDGPVFDAERVEF